MYRFRVLITDSNGSWIVVHTQSDVSDSRLIAYCKALVFLEAYKIGTFRLQLLLLDFGPIPSSVLSGTETVNWTDLLVFRSVVFDKMIFKS